jgi:hypothetical protein
MNYFKRFGSIKKLLRQNDLYKLLYGKESVDKEKLQKLNINICDVAQYGHETTKKINKIDGTKIYNNLVGKLTNDEYLPNEIIALQNEKLKRITYENSELPKNVVVAYDIDPKRYKFKLYCINNGKRNQFITNKEIFKMKPINENDVLIIGAATKDFESVYIGKDDNDKPIYEKNVTFPVWRINHYMKYSEVS